MKKAKHIQFRIMNICLYGGLLIGAIIFSLIYAPLAAMPDEETTSSSRPSYPYPDKETYKTVLQGLNGSSLSLNELSGKKVYIKFWATWCPQCLAGLEDFNALSKQYGSSADIAVISIVAPGLNGEVSKSDFIEWANAQALSFPVYFDETGILINEFGIKVYPTSVYLNKDGGVLKIKIGDEMNAEILATLMSSDVN